MYVGMSVRRADLLRLEGDGSVLDFSLFGCVVDFVVRREMGVTTPLLLLFLRFDVPFVILLLSLFFPLC